MGTTFGQTRLSLYAFIKLWRVEVPYGEISASHLSIFGKNLSRADAFPGSRGTKFVRRALEYKTPAIHKYACKPALFRTR